MARDIKASKPEWQRTKFSNLIRYVPSGTYFARVRVRGKLFRKSLKTDALSVAKLRLDDLQKEMRQAAENQSAIAQGKMTVADAARIYRQRLKGDTSLKPRTVHYYEHRVKALLKTWPGLGTLDVRKVTKTECLNWAAQFGEKAASSVFNNTAAVLRQILAIGVETGARYDNPARHIKRVSIRSKQLRLPEAHQFAAMVEEIASSGSRFSQDCARLVRFLAYGGFRKMEAANITWADCNFERGKILVRGEDDTGTKNRELREVPMIPEMRALLERLMKERPEAQPTDAVMKVHECQKAMDRAARLIGMERITHHDLRHLFATRCIESGVDIPTVSRWLGHKDGGALAMKVYGHLRDQHSTAMAQKVSFGVRPQPAVPQIVKEPPVRC